MQVQLVKMQAGDGTSAGVQGSFIDASSPMMVRAILFCLVTTGKHYSFLR